MKLLECHIPIQSHLSQPTDNISQPICTSNPLLVQITPLYFTLDILAGLLNNVVSWSSHICPNPQIILSNLSALPNLFQCRLLSPFHLGHSCWTSQQLHRSLPQHPRTIQNQSVMGHWTLTIFILFYFILSNFTFLFLYFIFLKRRWRRHMTRKAHDRSHDVTS